MWGFLELWMWVWDLSVRCRCITIWMCVCDCLGGSFLLCRWVLCVGVSVYELVGEFLCGCVCRCVCMDVFVRVFVILWWIEIECASYDPYHLQNRKSTPRVSSWTLYIIVLFMGTMCVLLCVKLWVQSFFDEKLLFKKVYGRIGRKSR